LGDAFDRARDILTRAIAARVFPAASVAVGTSDAALWSEAFGTLSDAPGSSPTTLDTPFDLASLTKVVATTTVVMDLVARGRAHLDAPVSTAFPAWTGVERRPATLRDLLEHASGLPARLPAGAPMPHGRAGFEPAICALPLAYTPRTRSVYSDLDFILLGFLADDCSGAPLDTAFDRLVAPVLSTPAHGILTFRLPDAARALAASTMPSTTPSSGDPRVGRRLSGDVHDDYAAALGGVAGHAGLFGTAERVGDFARTVLRAARGDGHLPLPFTPELVRLFISRSAVPASSRALGWDTMLPTSSCGTRMSASAIGHTGFTGTSLWIDPARDRYFVLLTNRVCGGGTPEDIRGVRRDFHDALGDV
jgi:CubicO group peptidase (beta-lactamase class C family)